MISRCTPAQLEQLCGAIDRLIATWIFEGDAEEAEASKQSSDFIRCALRQLVCNLKWKEIESFAKRIMYTVQLHSKCTFTCFKKKLFCASCRMAKPSPQVYHTKFSQLRTRKNQLDDIIIPLRDSNIDSPPQKGWLGLPSKDSRVL